MAGERRIVYINGHGYGNYQIQKRKKFLFIKYWSGTHLCNNLTDAKILIKWLETKPNYGEVIYSTKESYND